jgi:hypothetical protein
MPELQALHDELAPSGRFELVSLAQDEFPIDPYALIRQKGATWTQAYIGAASGSTAFIDYRVQGIPALFVVDTNGNILAQGHVLAELRPAIDKALAEAAANRAAAQ